MARDRLIPPNHPLTKIGDYWFSGPETPTDGYGYVTILGGSGYPYKETDLGVTIVNNRILRAPAAQLEEQGLFSMTLFSSGPRRIRLMAIISHNTGLLIATNVNVNEEPAYPTPAKQFVGLNYIWTEGENPQPVYWFEEASSRKLSEYSLSITR